MKIGAISNNNTNFQAKFVPDSKGILREAYQNGRMSDSARDLLYEFQKKGKNQEVEFVSRVKNFIPFYCDNIEVFNRTTGKTICIQKGSGETFWDTVLKAIVKNEDFFKQNDVWKALTGQKRLYA